jgi:mannose-1-phosphate guanylyltransferase/mannose-6-phosphate isomerase
MSKIVPVILCGGSGTRLWPRSRKTKPKPFLPLIGERTMFEATLGRCGDAGQFAPPVIVTGTAHLEHVEAQAVIAPGACVIVEPQAKNTAAAIALAAGRLPEEAVMLVCPSDHHIADEPAFRAAAAAAAQLAAEDWLVAFGIAATAPETGYGYIKRGAPLDGGYRVERFVEKPDLATAQSFLADGGYSWNGGIFAFRAGQFLAELARHRPRLAEAVARSVSGGSEDGSRFRPDAEAFETIEPESVDYAVMEETDRAAMVPVSMGWSDIGSWAALRDATDRNHDGNSIRGRAELVDCSGVFVDSDGPRVSVIGLSDVVIVVDGDEVLVTTTQGAQKVGKLEGAARQ